MSVSKRIIPCLDVDKGRVVKGVNFLNIRDAGDPVEIAKRYDNEGADEITMLDITASHETRDTTYKTVEDIASQVFIPLTVGGAVDAKARNDEEGSWEVVTYGGRNRTNIDVVEWTQQVEEYGAGEILLTSMDRDGTKEGFDNNLVSKVSGSIPIPVIASGGVGNLNHLIDGIKIGGAEAVLAASIFHFSEFTIQEAKDAMKDSGIVVRA